MTAEDVLAALALPEPRARPTRIHKVDLIDAGAPSTADKKLIDAAIDRLDWIATLSPATIGVAAGENVPAIQLLTLASRAEPTTRLLTLIHRAIPLPVVLVTAFDDALRISLGPLRPAERIDAMVVERLIVTPAMTARDAAIDGFLASLALSTLPRTDLAGLYEALIWRVEALIAARRANTPFRLPVNGEDASIRRDALAEHDAVTAELAKARSAARVEKALARQVALAGAAALVKNRLSAIAKTLA